MRLAILTLVLMGFCSAARGQTFEAEGLLSQTGGLFYNDRTGGDFVRAGREAIRGRHRPGFITYGPYIKLPALKSGYYWAQFKYRKSELAANRSPFITLEVYDATANRMIASKTISVSDASTTFGVFNLYFGRPNPANMLEFRTFWHGNASGRVDRVKIEAWNLRP